MSKFFKQYFFFVIFAAFSSPALSNSYVKDNLNAADMMFRSGIDGCSNVSIAISVSNSPSIYGPTSDALKNELRSYAKKCNLRY